MSRAMKDSGIPWIGEIPEGWEVKKIDSLYTLRNEKVSDKDYHPLSVTMKGILPQLETAAKTNDGDNRKLVKKGDFAINSRSDRRGSCGISDYDGSVSLINTVLCPRSNMNASYYNWLFHTSQFADEFYKWGHGIVDDLWTTRWQEMKSIHVVAPTLIEQEVIAEFLDRKCGEVDEMVALQEQVIEELKAYKQSIITEAVTKGLNPDAPMKPSGINWIGEIPEHWSVCQINALAMLQSGNSLKTEDITENADLYPVYGGNGIRGYYKDYLLDGKYVLIGRQGALCGNIKVTKDKFWVTEHAVICYPKHNYDITWFAYMLESMNLNQYSLSAAQPGLAIDRIKRQKMLLPPLSEQREIADYLDRKCADIDALIALKLQKIEDLREYKKSLIYEYVTGKKQTLRG